MPPTCWKKVRLLVAVPSRSTGTLFWTMSVNTANVGPTPRPVTNIHAHSTGIGVSDAKVREHEQPGGHQPQRDDHEDPVATGPAHDLAGGDGADDEPAEQRQHLVAGHRRRRPGHDLEPARQEDDAAKKPKAARKIAAHEMSENEVLWKRSSGTSSALRSALDDDEQDEDQCL